MRGQTPKATFPGTPRGMGVNTYPGLLSGGKGIHFFISEYLQPVLLDFSVEWQALFYPGTAGEDEFFFLPHLLLEFNGQGLLHGQLGNQSHHFLSNVFDPFLVAVHLEVEGPRLVGRGIP